MVTVDEIRKQTTKWLVKTWPVMADCECKLCVEVKKAKQEGVKENESKGVFGKRA
jgi:hypothetical protein